MVEGIFFPFRSVKFGLLLSSISRRSSNCFSGITLNSLPLAGCEWRYFGAAVRKNSGAPVSESGEKVTHTGQINEQFAINLIAEQPVTEVSSRVISCDGGGGALGHPKVYINLDKDSKTGTCGYCGLRFKQKHHH
uniref:NADH dehydrogenase [ubiquinone] iron-sulfur protein 6, mitochondrial n=1 Tax=Geotrypetes seraphini TaxID=260995 RepID=A0A6P8QED9_GEOSA|nr:NADH dehydrogenase [ubiquinone] iron-sulfur protein 6, mitochondrial isoform X2 [Geotrypetes seraphini]